MEERDKIKDLLKVLSEKLKKPENKDLLDEFVTDLSGSCSTGEQRLDDIYELCIEKIIKEQANAFYKDFPIEAIRPQLVDDFIRMEHFKRKDNFEDFCLAVYQQIECVVGYYFANEQFITEVRNHITDTAYESKDGKKQHADFIFTDAGHRAKLEIEDLYWIEKFRCIVYWNCFHKKWGDEFKEMIKKGNQLYQCRNLNHRNNTKTEYQENTLKEVLPVRYQYYLKFTALLSTFIEKLVDSSTIGVITQKLPGMAIARINGKDIELSETLLSKFEKGDSILVKNYTTKKGKTIIKEAEKI